MTKRMDDAWTNGEPQRAQHKPCQHEQSQQINPLAPCDQCCDVPRSPCGRPFLLSLRNSIFGEAQPTLNLGGRGVRSWRRNVGSNRRNIGKPTCCPFILSTTGTPNWFAIMKDSGPQESSKGWRVGVHNRTSNSKYTYKKHGAAEHSATMIVISSSNC